jgi:hypothetical protein
MPYYIIRSHDFLDRIAQRVGLAPDEIWNAPENERLRTERPDRNMLCAGDLLFIPRMQRPPPERVNPGVTNEFARDVARTNVRVKFATTDGPIASQGYRVEGAGPVIAGTTDAEGVVSFQVRVTVRAVRVRFPALGLTFPLNLGALDPLDEPTGIQMRLKQLGHYFGAIDGDLDTPDSIRGLMAFQRIHGLRTTGVDDKDTLAKLREIHGS